MNNRVFLAAIFATLSVSPVSLQAGEWQLTFGDRSLEGISVDETFSSGQYHLGLTSDAVWFSFSFPAADGAVPESARATRINLNGFDPNIQCTEIGDGGLVLEEGRITGRVVCTSPQGEFDFEARFSR